MSGRVWGDEGTGIGHAEISVKAAGCVGEICYNGAYLCDWCAREISPESHPAVYAALLQKRYPEGNYSDHPNFDKVMYEDGVMELADIALMKEGK